MAQTDLTAIRTKVRRLTHSPTADQISDAMIDEYINTALLYDFPETLRLFSLRRTLTFYTQPGVDVYETSTNPTDALFDFKNKYVAVHQPIYMAGVPAFYTQDRSVFYGYWPQTNSILDTLLRGNGTPGPFTGTLLNPNPPYPFILQNNVVFSCLDTSGESMVLIDYPVSNTTGALGLPNQPQTLPSPYGQINYTTGAFTLNFPNNTANAAIIRFEGILYQPGKPLGMLFFEDKFTIRPVPDQTYAIQIEVDVRPTELLAANQSPDLQQWWQYVALISSRLILIDRMDMDTLNLIMPELNRQERLVLRRTLELQSNERTTTIYTQGKSYGFGWFGPGGGWPY